LGFWGIPRTIINLFSLLNTRNIFPIPINSCEETGERRIAHITKTASTRFSHLPTKPPLFLQFPLFYAGYILLILDDNIKINIKVTHLRTPQRDGNLLPSYATISL
jgi:hypothetical protein